MSLVFELGRQEQLEQVQEQELEDLGALVVRVILPCLVVREVEGQLLPFQADLEALGLHPFQVILVA